jgi:hypothetical protein
MANPRRITDRGAVAELRPEASRQPLRQLRCIPCGYGVCCRSAPERCPMCGSASWQVASPKVRGWDLDLDRPLGRETPQ